MLNCIQQEVRFINDRHEIVATLPASDSKVDVIREQNESVCTVQVVTLGGVVEIPCRDASAAAAVRGLPADQPGLDILVPLVVAEAMRFLGILRSGRVFSPMPLVFDSERKPIGSPGVLLHRDLVR